MPLASLATTTVAPGTAAPDASRTVPATAPKPATAWAYELAAQASENTTTAIVFFIRLLPLSKTNLRKSVKAPLDIRIAEFALQKDCKRLISGGQPAQ